MTAPRVGILGGTFDPVHYGHIIPAEYAVTHLALGRLILVPADSPVHRPEHQPAPAEDRLAMCRLAAEPVPRFEVSDVELARSEPSYTVLTLEHFRDSLRPEPELFLLVGEDNLPHLHTWHRIRDILTLARVTLLPRPTESEPDLSDLRKALGHKTVDGLLAFRVPSPLVPVSATDIRRRLRAARPVDGLVPPAVADYIRTHGLYAA
jgi:nicotinate-nucleotide adenylyltransferase